MRLIYLLIILSCLSCNNERVLQLPEVKNTKITEVLDVSPAYIFYDETEADSTLLNRKNLIGTTNWLVNVDKRLSLKQAIPHIKMMQDKKRNAEVHKNEEAKNYFTCNDTSIGNLGFIEFTDVYYKMIDIQKDSISFYAAQLKEFNTEDLEVQDEEVISTNQMASTYFVVDSDNINEFETEFLPIIEQEKENLMLAENLLITSFTLIFYFDKNLSFQDYISIKSKLDAINTNRLKIITHEFIY